MSSYLKRAIKRKTRYTNVNELFSISDDELRNRIEELKLETSFINRWKLAIFHRIPDFPFQLEKLFSNTPIILSSQERKNMEWEHLELEKKFWTGFYRTKLLVQAITTVLVILFSAALVLISV